MNVPARGGVIRTTNDAPGRNHRGDLLPGAAPAVHAVVEAVELESVPVDRRRFGQAVHDGDLDRSRRGEAPAAGPATSSGRRRNRATVLVDRETRRGVTPSAPTPTV